MNTPSTYLETELATETPETSPSNRLFWVLIVLQIPLVLTMNLSPWISTAHALFVLALGVYFVLVDSSPARLLYVTGYMIGAEVLWRMTEAAVFWEYAKYALIILMTISVLRWRFKINFLAFIYLLPLLVSIFLVVGSSNIMDAREQISFNLSGHLLLALGIIFFSQIQLGKIKTNNLIMSMLLPILGISFLAFYSTSTAEFIKFTPDSNMITSGGFGPNQTSAVLGLGAMLCWLLVLVGSENRLERFLLLILGVGLLAQAMLTLSRGGVFNLLIALPFATLFLMRGSARSRNIAFFSLLLLGLALYFFLPLLNEFTGGILSSRFTETDTTGRLDLWQADIQTFQENLLFGVGPGGAPGYHKIILGGVYAAHTEYSRMLAEHGLFGLFSLVILAGLFVYSFFKARTNWAKGLTLAFMLWAIAEMSHSAMRIAAISYLYALPLAFILAPDE